jgi:hypothetical protein
MLFLAVGLGASGCGSDAGIATPSNAGATGGGNTQPPKDPPTDPPPPPAVPPAEGCNLHTGYAGDDQCILPPPPDKGFQVHVGPSDYANPETAYLLQAGEEKTTDFSVTSTNDQNIYFYYRQYRMRPTAHHVILSAANGTDVTGGRRIGTANASEDFPAGGVIAPEDKTVGSPLSAHSPVTVSFHAINATDKPQLREVWVNFWYRDPNEVTAPATEWFNIGSSSFAVQPHSATTLGPYTCTIQGDGRLLWLYGHRHANNVRFTVSRVRGTQRDVIYDANKWDDPLLLEYSSLVTNHAPDIDNGVEGGWNGILDLQTGDKIEWQCGVVNNNDTVLRFTNQTYLGEMCIVDAEAVGSNCNGL